MSNGAVSFGRATDIRAAKGQWTVVALEIRSRTLPSLALEAIIPLDGVVGVYGRTTS